MVTHGRHCTDVLCLFVFVLFWGGMGYVGYRALSEGNPDRILYGLDSYGNYCGMLNVKADGEDVDLRNKTKLYYLDPLELLDTTNYYYAKTTCVEACPTAERVCTLDSFPCTSASHFECPYYGYSQFNDAGTDQLGIRASGGFENTEWWAELDDYSGSTCVDNDFFSTVPQAVSDAMNATESCGDYYQLSSLYPGQGPCYAVLFETQEFMHRCYPVISEAAAANVTSISASSIAARVSSEQLNKVRAVLPACNAASLHLTCAECARVVGHPSTAINHLHQQHGVILALLAWHPLAFLYRVSAGSRSVHGGSKATKHNVLQMADRISALSGSGFNTYVTDAQRGFMVVIVAGPVAALVMCLLYMLFMRFFAGVMAWSVIILINVLCIGITILAAYKSELLGSLGYLSSLNDVMMGTGETLDGAALCLRLLVVWRPCVVRVSRALFRRSIAHRRMLCMAC